LAMRSSGGVALEAIETECRRSIHTIVHVGKAHGLRQVLEVARTPAIGY
jgi:hypothetical protein